MIVFLVDIILNFIICQLDENKKLLVNYSKIASFHFKGWLFFDIFSILPYELFF
jgi:hypothetical protein